MNCPDCGARTDHCHGTLVLHVDQLECTDVGCAMPYLASHHLVVTCGEVGCASCATARSHAA